MIRTSGEFSAIWSPGAKFDLAVPVLTSLVKFNSPFDIANRVQECASNRFQSSYDFVGFACSVPVFTLRF